jgi:hypothetical protein
VKLVVTDSRGKFSNTDQRLIEVASPAQLLNISTRLQVQTGDNVLIGGFIVTGNDPKTVVARAIGPSLNVRGEPVAGRLDDPTLELHAKDGSLIEANDNWKDSPRRTEIEGSGIAPSDDRESVIMQTLEPGFYTAIVRGKDDSTGIGLVEVYDRDVAATSQMANLSTRGFVQTDDNVMIGGFIAGNRNGNTKVLVRAIGPSLPVSGALADPTLDLFDANGAVLATNDNWKDTQQAEIESTGIPPSADQESAMLSSLVPGNYTAIVRGKDQTTGVALVEIYNIP